MPSTTSTTSTTTTTEAQRVAAAVAEALSEGRSTAAHLVTVGAAGREAGTGGGSVFAQVLDPRAGQEGRAAGLLRAAEAAGLLDPSFLPVPVFATDAAGQRVPVDVLTEGQAKVLRCAALGLSYTETAAALHLSVSTVKGHVGAYYKRLGVHTVPEAVCAAIRCGALPLSVLTGTEAAEAPTEAPSTEAPRTSATCQHDGCRKRVRHESGLCPSHRA